MSGIIALEVLLVQYLYAPCLAEVGRMTVPGTTDKCSLLETARVVTQTTVILDVCSKGGLLAEVEFTRDFRVDTLHEVTAQVEVDKVVPRA